MREGGTVNTAAAVKQCITMKKKRNAFRKGGHRGTKKGGRGKQPQKKQRGEDHIKNRTRPKSSVTSQIKRGDVRRRGKKRKERWQTILRRQTKKTYLNIEDGATRSASLYSAQVVEKKFNKNGGGKKGNVLESKSSTLVSRNKRGHRPECRCL